MLSFITGCGTAVIKNEIEEPEKPAARVKTETECISEEMHANEWYSELCGQLMDFETSCVVDKKVSDRDVNKALVQLYSDFPEIFWIGNAYYATTVTDGSEIVLDYAEGIRKDDIPEMYDKFTASADKLIESIPQGSDYDKILYVHDYIIDNTVYNYGTEEADKYNSSHTAYGCLVDGNAVCEGYAKAFQYIMNRIGIESGICTGSNHAWNYVKLDGEYYWIDTTWDDTDETRFRHTYFLFNDEMLLRTRNFDIVQSFVPECTSVRNNYFEKNGRYFTEYDEQAVISCIENNSENGSCEIMFADFESYKTALYSLFGDLAIGKADGVKTSDIIYYRYDDMFTVRIENL